MISKIKPYLTPFNIFLTLVFAGFAGYLFYAVRYGVVITDWLMMENLDLGFPDFKMHVGFVADPVNLYERANEAAGCFPPLSYVMYYFIFRILYRAGFMPYTFQDVDRFDHLYLMLLYYSFIVVFLILGGILIWFEDRKRAILLFACLMVSVPFYAGGISVANSTMIVMAFLLIALKLRDSTKPAVREIALIMLAICAGFKIYPAVFGLLYLLEKRFKEAVRLTIYGIFLFFTPFAFFGGLRGMKLWWSNIRFTMGYDEYGRIQTIRGLLFTAGKDFGTTIPEAVLKLVPLIFALLMIVLACVTKSRYRRLFFLCSIMIFFPNNAYRYTLCYLSVPLVIMFGERDPEAEHSRWTYAEIILYSLVYSVPVLLGKVTQFKLTYEYYTLTFVEGWVYIFAYILLITVIIHEIWSLRHAV